MSGWSIGRPRTDGALTQSGGLPLYVVVPGRPRGQGSIALWRGDDGVERAKHSPETVLHRNAVIGALRQEWGGRDPMRGPVRVVVELWLMRPKAHYGTGRNAGVLKDSAPTWAPHYPDIDKALRLVLDALTYSGVIGDDVQVVEATALKRWGATGSTAITVVEAGP